MINKKLIISSLMNFPEKADYFPRPAHHTVVNNEHHNNVFLIPVVTFGRM